MTTQIEAAVRRVVKRCEERNRGRMHIPPSGATVMEWLLEELTAAAEVHDTEQSTRDCGNTADLKPAAVSPTQAQIAAALGGHNHVFKNGRCIACDFTEKQIAAITAAAEVEGIENDEGIYDKP